MKRMRKIIEIDETLCDGCGLCVPNCAEGALRIVNGKARMVSEVFCDGLGACLGHCPQDALKIVEREVEAFDEAAVKEYLQKTKEEKASAHQDKAMPCGCPSANIRMFSPPCQVANQPKAFDSAESELSHWPVQIRLVPAGAPFLKGADLLIAADCAPVAYAGFHQDFLMGKVVMMGCPKFDDLEDYFRKFVEIFTKNDTRSVTILSMEVPCCSKLPMAVKQAVQESGKSIPVENVIVGVRGQILSRD